MKIALAQVECKLGDVFGNLQMMRDCIDRAAADGADMIVFPEMCDTGYEMQTILRHAATADGAPRREICASAARHRVWVVAGLSLREGERVFNTAVVFDRAGAIAGEYRKSHLFTGAPVCEHEHLAAGDSLVVLPVEGFRVGLMICYDMRFPEVARSLTLSGAELIVAPTAWPVARIGHWTTLTAARAIENLAYVIAVNRVGIDSGLQFGGSSQAVAPWGEPLCQAGGIKPQIVTATVDLAAVRDARQSSRVLRDRRPEIYRTWGV